MPTPRRDKIEKGDSSEWARRIVAETRARVESKDPRQTDLFGAPEPEVDVAPVEAHNQGTAPEQESADNVPTTGNASIIAEKEAKVTLALKAYERLIDSGIDRANPRVGASMRAFEGALYAYEQAADLEYYRTLQAQGRRPQQ